jgi:hypothetical protein
MDQIQDVQHTDPVARMRFIIGSVFDVAVDDPEIVAAGAFPELDLTNLDREFFAEAKRHRNRMIYMFLFGAAIWATGMYGLTFADSRIILFAIGCVIGTGVLVWLCVRERNSSRRLIALLTERNRRWYASQELRNKLLRQISFSTFTSNDKPS